MWACGLRTPVLTPPLLILSSLQRSVSDNTLVAMDFSGRAGRVIANPQEVQSAAMEEAQAWRVSSPLCLSAVPASNGAFMEWEEEEGLGRPRVP